MPAPFRFLMIAAPMAALWWAGGVAAQTKPLPGTGPSIYTCVDAQGRKLTSDRPIAACMDREQRELSPSGVVRRIIPPQLTAAEREAMAAKAAAQAAERARLEEEQRRDRALTSRFPNEETHSRARTGALEQVTAVIATIERRREELLKQRGEIDAEMEFYQRDPSKAPAWLLRRSQENHQMLAEQDKRLTEQEAEKRRINDRFDEELAKLRKLWDSVPAAPAASR
jgi:hypothetical protein